MRVCTEHTMILLIARREALHLAGTQIPGIEGLADHTPVLTVYLEALVPVHAHCHRQIEMTGAAIGELYVNEPAIGTEFFDQPGLEVRYAPSQEARGIDACPLSDRPAVALHGRL